MENNTELPTTFSYTKEQLNEVAYLMFRGKSQAEIGRRMNLPEFKIQKLSTIVMNLKNWEELLPVRTHTREEMSEIEDELFTLLNRNASGKHMSYEDLQRMGHLGQLYSTGLVGKVSK